jgi:hypothetical protein
MKTNTKFQSNSGKGSSASRIGDRGMRVLALACEERAIRVDLGARILGLKPSAFVSIVNRLQRLGLVEQERFLVKERYAWVWPTRSGLRADGRGYPFYRPSVGQLRHMAGVAATRAACVASDPGAVWVPERALVREHGRCKWHLADAALEVDGRRVAIEVELSGKDRYRADTYTHLRAHETDQ